MSRRGHDGARAVASPGDVVRCLRWPEVANDPEAVRVVLAALGWRVARALPASAPPALDAAPKPPPGTPAPEPEPEPEPSLPSQVSRSQSAEAPASFEAAAAGALPLPEASAHVPLYWRPIEPLVEPRHAAGVFGRVAVAEIDSGATDVASLVRTVAQGRVFARLPRQASLSFARGLHLLLDMSPAMAPFRDDMQSLIEQLRRVVGAERVRVVGFDTCPGASADAETGGFQPRPGTPVLAVTDLGLVRAPAYARAAAAAAWLDLNRALTAAAAPLTILTPYPRERLEAGAVLRQLRIVIWDRGLTARKVARPRRLRAPP